MLWTSTQRSAKPADVPGGAPTQTPARRGARSAASSSTQRGTPSSGESGGKQDVVATEVGLPSSTTLSAELHEEVTHRPVPVDIGALPLLRGSPLRLDVST